jgi:hypothetical protein
MKTTKLYFIALAGLMLSCAGSDSENNSTGDNTTEQGTDSLPAGAAFEEFVSYTESLPQGVENVDSVFEKFENLKADFSPEEKDSAFFVVVSFMGSLEITEEEMGDMSEDSQKKLVKNYGKHGLEIWWAEGYPYPMPDLKFVEQKFKKDISTELDDYLDVYKKTFIQITNDGGLVIEWPDLADILLICEEYLTENPESKYADRVLASYMENLNFLMWGLDNTPVIDRWTDETKPQLDETVSDVYQKLIKDNKHKTGKIIADHLTWLESKAFDYYYDEIKYLSTEEVKLYLGL